MTPAMLFIFAHPDDESFSGAGTAMKYAAEGVRTILLTATRGERGKCGDPPLCTPEELGAWREQELRNATAIIGFDELHLLDYRDRELAEAPPADIRRAIVDVIRRTKPALVLTFDPNGFNVHPDHVAISRFASEAIAAADDPRWCPDAGEPHRVQRLVWTSPFPPWEGAKFDRLDDKPGADFTIDVSAWRERRAAALRAHRSQHLSINRCFFDQPDLDRVLATETWRHAWGPALRQRPATDVMEGLRQAP
jgi:LmbE family N-acetylglucosaminyl deacetylase